MDNLELNGKTIVKNVSDNQQKILYDIMMLHNDGKPFECDITASELKFYLGKNGEITFALPEKLFDVCPIMEGVEKITPFQKLPLDDNSVGSVVVDLPFCITPKTAKSMVETKDGSNIISKRFSSWYPAMEAYENIFWWMRECARVLKDGGIVVWKMQSTVSGGIEHWFTPFSFICAQDSGLYVIDEFILTARARLISAGKYKEQQHARKYTSTFWVFKKDDAKAKKTNCLTILEHCKAENLEGKVWPVK